MKKFFFQFFPFILILLFSLFASHKLFNPQFYTSHDGEGHIIRMIEFEDSLKSGQIPVRFAKRINHGLGYPYFNFNYPFIYYASFGIHSMGVSYVDAFKIILVLSSILGGLGMFLFCRKYFSITPSVVAAIFYILAPYKFLNMYVRGSIAEVVALGLLPFLFLVVEMILESRKNSIFFFILVLSILITSHNITVFFSVPLLILYFSLRILKMKEKRKPTQDFILGFILSALLTCFFWFPALYEARLTKLAELTEDYRAFFPSLSEILYSPWGFGSYVQGNASGKMSPQIGLVPVFVSVLAIVILVIRFFKRKREEKDFLFLGFILVAMLCFFLLFQFSLILWDNIFYLKLVQHPWRLVGYITLSTSIAVAYIISAIKNKKIAVFISIIIILVLVYTVRNMIRVNMYVNFNDPFLNSQVYGPGTTSKDEHMPRLAPRIYEDPNPNGDIIASTSGIAKRISWRSIYHKFEVTLVQQAELRDNTSYFPGWKGYVDGEEVPLLYMKDEFYRLRVAVPKGKHTVEFKYSEIWYRLIADILSITIFCGIVMYLVWQKLKKRQSLKKFHKKLKTVKHVR